MIFHAIILFGISSKLPYPEIRKTSAPLEVVLINNSKSASEPRNTGTLARANLNGGANTANSHQAKSPLALAPAYNAPTDAAAASENMEQLEKETEKSTEGSNHQDAYPTDLPSDQSEQNRAAINGSDLVQRSLEIARLEAQTARDYEAYQRRPKRRFVGARTQEYRFARYIEDWRLKVERIGNMNYPEAARRENLYGNLQLTVGIKSDGSLESLELNRSSGEKILDEAAIRIVKLAGQNGFAPFPPDVSRDTDILHITRIWSFTRSDGLTSQ